MYARLKTQRLFAFSFLVLYLLQNEVIYPIEASIRTDEFASVASFAYFPHGLKVFCALAIGISALPLIFLAQSFNTIYFQGSFGLLNLMDSLFAMVSVGVPIILFNRTLKQKITKAPLAVQHVDLSSFWLFINFAIVTAILNSFIQTLIYGLPSTALSWYFLLGDIMGSAGFFVIAIIMMKAFSHFLVTQNRTNNNDRP